MSHIDHCINAANSVDRVKFKGTVKKWPVQKLDTRHSTEHAKQQGVLHVSYYTYLFSVNNSTCVATHCILMAVKRWVQELLQVFFETVLDILQNILNFIICSTLSIVLMFKQYWSKINKQLKITQIEETKIEFLPAYKSFTEDRSTLRNNANHVHSIHRWWRHYVILTSILDRRITPYLGDLCFRKYSSRMINEFGKLCLIYSLRV